MENQIKIGVGILITILALTGTILGKEEKASRVQLTEGWNLVALNGTPEITSTAFVMSSVVNNLTVVWGYDKRKEIPWELYDPAMPEALNTLNNIIPEQDYWIYAKANVEWTAPLLHPDVKSVNSETCEECHDVNKTKSLNETIKPTHQLHLQSPLLKIQCSTCHKNINLAGALAGFEISEGAIKSVRNNVDYNICTKCHSPFPRVMDSDYMEIDLPYDEIGNYTINVTVTDEYGRTGNDSVLVTVVLPPTPVPEITTISLSEECGRNVNTKEQYSNIKQHEYSKEIFVYNSTIPIAFSFNTLGIVTEAGYTPKTNEGCITALGEMLKGSPSYATTDVPYKDATYFNVWVGPTGYSESSKVENQYVVFKKTDDEIVKLMMYKESEWIDLKTEKISDGIYKAYTQGFGSFAIVNEGNAFSPRALSAGPKATPPSMPGETPGKAIPAAPKSTPGFEIATAIAAISVLYVLGRRRN